MESMERAARIEQEQAMLKRDVSALRIDVAVLKTILASLKADTASIMYDYATKADLLDFKHSIIRWLVSVIFLGQLLLALLEKYGL